MIFRKNYLKDCESVEFKLDKISFTNDIANISIHFEQQEDNDGEATASLSVVLTDMDGSNVGQVNEDLSEKQLDILIGHLTEMKKAITKDTKPNAPRSPIGREPIIALYSNDSEPVDAKD